MTAKQKKEITKILNAKIKNSSDIELQYSQLCKLFDKTLDEQRKEIINYQHGFVRDDGFGNPERAPEWQVIEDLIKTLK